MVNDKSLHVRLPSSYHKALKQVALDTDKKLNDVVIEALKDFLISKNAIKV